MPSVTRTASCDLGGGHYFFFRAFNVANTTRRAVRSLFHFYFSYKETRYATSFCLNLVLQQLMALIYLII